MAVTLGAIASAMLATSAGRRYRCAFGLLHDSARRHGRAYLVAHDGQRSSDVRAVVSNRRSRTRGSCRSRSTHRIHAGLARVHSATRLAVTQTAPQTLTNASWRLRREAVLQAVAVSIAAGAWLGVAAWW